MIYKLNDGIYNCPTLDIQPDKTFKGSLKSVKILTRLSSKYFPEFINIKKVVHLRNPPSFQVLSAP